MTTYVHLLLLLISSCPILANASDTILQGQLIRVSDTIVSSGNVFEFGFFSAGESNSTMSYYVGLWFKKFLEQTVVWVANWDYPLTDSSVVLTIGVDGNLVIVEGRISYIVTNISSTSGGNTSATLLDSGNLVLIDGRSGELLWQSFDYPTHTFLPGMKLGYDRRNGKTWYLLSWKSRDDPGPGVFSLELDPQGTSQFFIVKGSQKYWASGTWNGQTFAMMPEMGMHNDAYKLTYISNQNESYFTSFNDLFVRNLMGEWKLKRQLLYALNHTH
ncbi:hypothetical protein Acr_23g0008230 [Actinidia rufa]|uniref:Bulb-type lectin domain-containing protein n=1 Tax=Actinidia rufa TaxID=165716 RepID=A0A7J0GNV8_9ERIC|nr:hypothetical protein Acr_23g0008230 [Actinidia rufa]